MFVVLLVQVRAPLRLGKPPGRPCVCGPASGSKDRPFKPEPWTTAAWPAWRSCTGRSPWTRRSVKEEVERGEPPRYVQKRPLPQVPLPPSAKKAKSERLISFSEYGSGIYLFIKIINFRCPDRFQLKLQQINSFTLQLQKSLMSFKQSIDTTNHHSFQMF